MWERKKWEIREKTKIIEKESESRGDEVET